jgi:lysophospholipase L1-like esterase
MKSKIIALGDSIIKGVVLNIESNGKLHYALSDRNIVDQVANKTNHEAINLGKIGCTIEAGEKILDRHLGDIENAQYALLCYGGNDSDYNWRAIAQSPRGEHQPKTPISVFEKTYARIIDKVRQAGLTPIVMSMPAMDAERYYQFFTSVFSDEEKRNVSRWLKNGTDAIWAGHELYNDAIKRVAAATDAILVDVSRAFSQPDKYLCIDGIHVNAMGQTKIAAVITKAMS